MMQNQFCVKETNGDYMITVFNKKELTVTSMKECAKVREILSSNGIEYIVRAMNHQSPVTGVLTVDPDYLKVYIIYVKKSDYEKAREKCQIL